MLRQQQVRNAGLDCNTAGRRRCRWAGLARSKFRAAAGGEGGRDSTVAPRNRPAVMLRFRTTRPAWLYPSARIVEGLHNAATASLQCMKSVDMAGICRQNSSAFARIAKWFRASASAPQQGFLVRRSASTCRVLQVGKSSYKLLSLHRQHLRHRQF